MCGSAWAAGCIIVRVVERKVGWMLAHLPRGTWEVRYNRHLLLSQGPLKPECVLVPLPELDAFRLYETIDSLETFVDICDEPASGLKYTGHVPALETACPAHGM